MNEEKAGGDTDAQSVQSTLARLSHVFLAFDQHRHHLAQLLQPRKHNLVPFHKAIALVLDLRLFAELANQALRPAQIVSWYAGEQVMHGLELEAAVEPVKPGRTVDVHGSAKLALGKGLSGTQIRSRHAPMGKCDLHVEYDGHGVAQHHEANANGPVGQG